ncbi:flagellar basal-body MS-ring/collar protein FliF [Nocardioides sp. YIM 152315]|uniref:flagellar basal-body MS-ring/collar protein FliF n=1 Tax=Nocardioides sp. YIM 152315 TaxID=3031760 RepID=UPI0023DC54AD|nr:flagellar basal-body MS-ring/collar protein FliF [Nocardioides sp. YIM 152315]MDF1605962.1 flagellar basal-body MS-ring/collar protein FliF [Nocardioides sp. YIM 152315]
MKQNVTRSLTRLRTTFLSLTLGQRLVAVVGTGALLLAAFMVFRWVSTPNYAPLFSNMASEDASAVIDELEATGVPYELSDGGSTVMVPRDQVYSTRIDLSGQGLPANSSDGGYSILDGQDISTSDFQEQTDFKRAMEGELTKTIEAIDGVNTAVVHLAMPEKKVFSDEQDPTTASVLVDTSAGTTIDAGKVQAIINLVASSIDGLDPANVTVADSTGKVLSTENGAGGAGTGTQSQAVADFQTRKTQQIQGMLDRVLGPGNSTVQVSADLDFDKTVQESVTYNNKKNAQPLSESSSKEAYNGVSGAGGSTGVVGPDGQMDSGAGATGTTGENGTYSKESVTRDNAVETVKEHRETAPGAIRSLHVGVVLDSTAAAGVDPADVQDLIAATVGIDPDRGDTVEVSSMAFDRTVDETAAAEIAAADKAKAEAQRWKLIRNAGIAVAVLAMLLLAWLRGRRGRKQREERTAYLVEQLRQDASDRVAAAAALEPAPAVAALDAAEQQADDELKREIAALAEREPDEIATLLRGWLVERH